MNNVELYNNLKHRAELINNKIARLEGERQAYIKKLKEKGFTNTQQVLDFIKEKTAENEQKQQKVKAMLDEYESKICKLEELLGEFV